MKIDKFDFNIQFREVDTKIDNEKPKITYCTITRTVALVVGKV
jgi:hypothetical protein